MGKTNKDKRKHNSADELGKKKTWMPKLRAATFKDKRSKRLGNRSDQIRSFVDEEE